MGMNINGFTPLPNMGLRVAGRIFDCGVKQFVSGGEARQVFRPGYHRQSELKNKMMWTNPGWLTPKQAR